MTTDEKTFLLNFANGCVAAIHFSIQPPAKLLTILKRAMDSGLVHNPQRKPMETIAYPWEEHLWLTAKGRAECGLVEPTTETQRELF